MRAVRKPAEHPRTSRRLSTPVLGITILGCILSGLFSLLRGQDNGYDLRYYHYYIPYALLHGRIDFDYAPAQLQSYLNPLSFVPFYLLAAHLPAVVVGFIQGAAHGLLVGLVFVVARDLFLLNSLRPATPLALLSALLALWGPLYVGLIGSSVNDFLIAQLVLVAILLVLRWWRRGKTQDGSRSRLLLASGLVLGIAAGLKMSALIYAVAAVVALAALPLTWRTRARIVGAYAIALAVGFLASAGWWMIVLQSRFGNPMFPFFNATFRSPDYPATNFADKRALPQGLGEALIQPFRILTGAHREAFGYHDARYFVLAVLVVLVAARSAVVWARRRRSVPSQVGAAAAGATPSGPATERFMLVFVVVAYILWQHQFSILRYASPLEAVVPIVLVLLAYRLSTRPLGRGLLLGAATIAIVASMRPTVHERMPWSRAYLHAEAPRFDDPSQVLVVIAHNAPWAYVLPALQPEIRVMNVRSNLTKPTDTTRFQTQMRDIIARHLGTIMLLTDSGYLREDIAVMRTHYDLSPADDMCARIVSRHQSIPIYLCRLQRAAR